MMFSSVAAAGGVLVALTLFHAGAIEKTISTACSMAITVLLENVLFSKQIQQFELFDCLTVFISSVTFSSNLQIEVLTLQNRMLDTIHKVSQPIIWQGPFDVAQPVLLGIMGGLVSRVESQSASFSRMHFIGRCVYVIGSDSQIKDIVK